MAKKGKSAPPPAAAVPAVAKAGKPSALLDTRVVYCGDNLEQLAKLPDACVDLIYIDPPFNSDRRAFRGEGKKEGVIEGSPTSTTVYIYHRSLFCVGWAARSNRSMHAI